MASLSTVKLSKPPGTSWGFRLQGGKDFATPLCIQKVNVGSVAAQAGLQAGDTIVSIAGVDALTLRHKEAQDTIVRAGNSFDVVIQRGSQIWKPNITTLPEVKTLSDGVPVATKTSLAATQKPFKPIGTRHNVSAAPFKEGLVLPAYNTPINIYSDDSIAETLSAQAEVLGKTGVMGVNFMKNDKNFDGQSSDVLRMVHEMDHEPPVENPGTPTDLLGPPDRPVAHSHSFKLLQQSLKYEDATPPAQGYPSGVSGVSAPVTNAASPGEQLRPGENTCFVCERLVVGVFVRVKGKNLHAECFKCSTCGSSLKNVGYYNINDKLYCDAHAKQAARVNPPAPNLEPVVVPPGANAPFGAVTAQQASRMKVPAAFQQNAAPPSHAPVPAPEPEPPAPVFQEVQEPAPEPVSERAPVSAPAPPKSFAPAPAPAPALAPVAAAPRPAPNFGSSANPQGFGAPAHDANVRSHIPKKGDVPAPMSFASAPAPAPAPFAPVSAPVYAPAPAPIKPTPPGLGGPGPVRGVLQAPGHRTAPRRGRGIMNQASGSRIPVCSMCTRQIRGPFVSALGKTWCPDHFICATTTCKRNIIDMGFVEEKGGLYCENCYESYMAPICGKCDKRIKGDCLNAVGKQFHPECFCCAYCGRVFGSGAFYLEDGLPYCETDWNDLFTTKCVGCNFPIEAGDRWVEALNNNYHSQCFKCSKCHLNLEGQSFFAKGGKPFCKSHAQRGIL